MRITAPFLAFWLTAGAALAGDAGLRPGKPAGVYPAQNLKTTELVLFGVAIVAALGLGYLAIGKGSSSNIATSTSP